VGNVNAHGHFSVLESNVTYSLNMQKYLQKDWGEVVIDYNIVVLI